MVIKYEKYSPFDYSDDKIEVYFKVADVVATNKALSEIDYIEEIIKSEYGFIVHIAIQQIPEIIFSLSEHNIAIYGVIPKYI